MAYKALEAAPAKEYQFPCADHVVLMKDTYLNNPMIKKAKVEYPYTPEQIFQIHLCVADPIYFIETYVKIISIDDGIIPFRMYDFQKDLIRMYHDNRYCIALQARQSGKTTTTAAFILWFAIFNKSKDIAILANKADQAQEVIHRIREMFMSLPFFLQPGCKVFNKRSISFDNGSRIFSAATSSSSIRGKSCVSSDTKIKVRSKITGVVEEITMREMEIRLTSSNPTQSSPDQTYLENDEYEVWTPDGWSDFDGLVINHNRDLISLSDRELVCTPCHMLMVDGVFVRAGSLSHTPIEGHHDVYDLYNVHARHQYYTNDEISHNCAFLYIDEAAFIENDAEFFESTYPVITSGKNSRVILSSTPKGQRGEFYRYVMGAMDGINSYKIFKATWDMIPGRDEAWKQEITRNIGGEARFSQEFECVTGDTLITLRDGDFVFDISIADAHAALGEMEFNSNTTYEILTPDGFQPFDGIQVVTREEYVEVRAGDHSVKCSLDHVLITPTGQSKANELMVGDMVVGIDCILPVTSITKFKNQVKLYDVVNAGHSHIYYTNRIVSHNCSFIGSSGTLIPPKILQSMVFRNPISDDDSMQIYTLPDPKRKYVATVDCGEGLGMDYSVCTVFDVTQSPYRIAAKYRNNTISPLLFPYTIKNICEAYNNCPAVVESNNDVGGQVCYILYYELEYENMILSKKDIKGRGMVVGGNRSTPGVKMSTKVKGIGCSNLKTLIENGALIVEDFDTISELGTFIASKNSFEADEGCHDDCCMTLVMFAWFVKQDFFSDFTDSDIGASIFSEAQKQMMEDVMPFGFHSDNRAHVIEAINNNQIKVTQGSGTVEDLERWMTS